MTGKTHQVLGLTAGIGYFLAVSSSEYNPATFGAVLVGSHLSSLMPDLDRSTADFWNSLPYGKTAGRIIDPLIKHRHVSHSLAGLLVFGIAVWRLAALFPDYWNIDRSIFTLTCVLAYASHIIADLLTVNGVPLLFPYKKMFGFPPKPFENFRMMTGKWFENIVVFPLANVILLVMIAMNLEKIKSVLFK